MPVVCPSWFTPVPRITALMQSPSRRASSKGFNTTTAIPSPRPYPLALASNVFDNPSLERKLIFDIHIIMSGFNIKLVPATMPRFASPSWIALHARCSATRLDEHAVSSVRLGPRQSKNHDTRFASIPLPMPVAVYFGAASASLLWMSHQSLVKEPT